MQALGLEAVAIVLHDDAAPMEHTDPVSLVAVQEGGKRGLFAVVVDEGDRREIKG